MAVSGAISDGIAGTVIRAGVVDVNRLRPNPFQPRDRIDKETIKKLAESIGVSGIIQPIVVRESSDGLQIVAGERRWLAAKVAGMPQVPAIIREASDEQMLEWALVENIHREDLNAIDRGRAYKRYCDTYGLTAEEAARRLGENRTTVTNYVRLLDLPAEVQRLLSANIISMGHARALLGAGKDSEIVELAALISKKGMSVRALENLIRSKRSDPRWGRALHNSTKEAAHMSGGLPAAHIRELEGKLEGVFGSKVRIQLGRSRGSGRIVVEFSNIDDFDRICKALGLAENSGDALP